MTTDTPGWQPPHCPNHNCQFHQHVSPAWRYKRKGFYARRCAPKRIQRFTCLHCGRNFSTQTVSTSYWLKRPDLMPRLFLQLVGSMCNRQVARAERVAPATIQHQISRLGRHCLLFHARQMEQIGPTPEIVVDGFETFEWSQYFPFHHNVAVDPATGYFLFHTDSPLRRKGRMTGQQKRRRAELEVTLGRPDPKAIRRGMAELLGVVARGVDRVVIRSDDHPAYPRAMEQLFCEIEHRVTSGKEHRDQHNSLWEVNLLDLLIRHSTAAHRRETIAWVKRRQSSAEKLAVLQVWRNNVKRRWENGPPVTPAMLRGAVDRVLGVRDVLRERLFRTRIGLPESWSRYYEGGVETAALAVNRRHELKYAF
jgi:transposase-like protein